MTNAKTQSGTVEFAPLDIEQFRRGFVLFLHVLSGQVKPPAPPATYLDAATGRVSPLEDTTFNRAWMAAGKLFTDEVLRLSFYQRLELFGSLARRPKYDRYLGFCQPSLHLAFVAALACCQSRKGMTEKECILAFDEELQRQLRQPPVQARSSAPHGQRETASAKREDGKVDFFATANRGPAR